jgi:hypothetical protein
MASRPVFVSLSVALLAASTACTAHFSGALQVDGQPFELAACRSGQALGVSGVELLDARDRRQRVAQNLDGSPAVVYFPSGQEVGEPLGPCAKIQAGAGTGVVNGVRNVDGTATLSCETPQRRVTGSVRFENCH